MKTTQPCKNFKKYTGKRPPKSKCCVACWCRWHSKEIDRLYAEIDEHVYARVHMIQRGKP